MGQTCCKPSRGSRCSRLSRVKAEAAAAAAAARDSDRTPSGPDPSVVQLLDESNNGPSMSTSTAAPPGSEPMSLPLTIPQVDANREVRITIEDNDPSHDFPSSPKTRKSRRSNSREWLQQQRKRFTKPRSFGQTKKTKKNKVALAHDEIVNEGSHPIVMVEASTMSREGSSSCNGSSSHAPLLVGGERIYLTPSGSGISQARYQPGLPLLSPTPRRPNPNRFPFLNPATISTETTHSNNDPQVNRGPSPSHQAGVQHTEENHMDGEQRLDVSNSMMPSTIIAVRRPARTDGEQRGHYGSVTSNSPSIYYLAPSSPQILPNKEKRASSVPSEALEPFPALEDEDGYGEEHHGEVQNDMAEDYPTGGDDVGDNAAENEEEQVDETQDAEVQEGVIEDSEEEQGCPLLGGTDSDDKQGCPLQADPELDSNFLSAVMAFVASSQRARSRSVSLTRDEQRPEILVHSSNSA